ncbi:MAG: dipeptidase PepE [Cryomorphaceae bacterium]|nr:dipeptidase PepE [Cryomorphaceae bacterium]MBL6866910.1 dipeptidase PepE [Cryomorphaceae bacterium]
MKKTALIVLDGWGRADNPEVSAIDKAKEVFSSWGFEMRGAHEFTDAQEGCRWADGFFTGGGNTFVLTKTLYESGYFNAIDTAVQAGKPYMGTSAGANLTGISICTTNDMPIVYPPSFEAWGWVPFNINAHYLDPVEGSTHMGETRETRIKEFHHFNDQPVYGLREGSWIRVENGTFTLKGEHTARIFEQVKDTSESTEVKE